MSASSEVPRSARRWFRFRLRTLLLIAPLLTIAVAFGLARWYLDYLHAWAIAEIDRHGGVVSRDNEGHVTSVELPGAKIDDAALAQLAPALAALPKLKTLVLASNSVTDAGLEHVAALHQLDILHVTGTKVTPEGLAKLQSRRPGLTIDVTTPHPRAMVLAAKAIYRHAIIALAQGPDGTLVSGSGDGQVRLWDRTQSEQAAAFAAHPEWVFAIARHPRNDWMATGGGDGLIKLWNWSTGREIARFVGHEDDVHGLAFTPAGDTLVSSGDDLTVRLWDVATRQERFVLHGHDDTIPAVAVDRSGLLAASASRDGTIRLWKIATGENIGVLRGHKQDVMSVDFHPQRSELASASYDGTVKVWDIDERRLLHTLSGNDEWAFCVRYSPDGQRLAATFNDGVRVWDCASRTLQWHATEQRDVATALWLNDHELATAAAEGSILIRSARGPLLATLWTRFYDLDAQPERTLLGADVR